MKNAYHNPDATLTSIDVLSDPETMIMAGGVEIGILKLYHTFNRLTEKPSPAMRQRVEEALEMLEVRQDVPARSVRASQPATITNATTAQDHAVNQENISSPSADSFQLNSKSSTTSSNKTGPPRITLYG